MRTVRRLLAAVLFVAALVAGWRFADANQEAVRVDYLLGAAEGLPLWSALVVAFALGLALAGLFALYQGVRLSLTARRWRKVAEGLQSEIHELRNLPLAAQPEGTLRGSAGRQPAERAGEASPAAVALEPTSRGR
jgi:uncharacterized membrane protein YciS (DUF1049 family)